MLIVLQTVVLLEVVHQFLVNGAVGRREDVADVVDGVVQPVTLDAVVGLDALADVVIHFFSHGLLVRDGKVGDEQQDGRNGCENDEFSEAAVRECLAGRLFLLIGSSVCLIHGLIVWLM